MAFDLRSQQAGDVAQSGPAQGSSMAPGRRSAAGELHGGGGVSARGAGAGGPSLFAGPVEWEDLAAEDPAAQAEAQEEALLPAEDEDTDSGPADEEGELDADSEADEEEAAGEPEAPAAPAGEPGQAPAPAPAPQAGAGGGAAPAAPGRAPARGGARTYHVNRAYRDGPYGGTAKYDVRVTAKDITVTVGIRLKPKRGVTRAQVNNVKSASQAIFKQKFDRRFKLTEIPYKPRPLRMQLRFSHSNPHHDVALHKGGGRDNAANWYVQGDNTTRAHEIGHLLGLKDEYADNTSPKRKVYTDNSLMGNYYNEGIKTASLKKRHGKVFAGDISRASGRKFYISS